MRSRRLPRRTDSRQGARTRAGSREPPRAPSAHERRDLAHQERHSRALAHRGDHLTVKHVKHLGAGKSGRLGERESRGWPEADLVTAPPLRGDASAAALLVARPRSPSGSASSRMRSSYAPSPRPSPPLRGGEGVPHPIAPSPPIRVALPLPRFAGAGGSAPHRALSTRSRRASPSWRGARARAIRSGMPRPNGRAERDLRQIVLEPRVSKHAEGSCLARFGDTHVLCTASIEEKVPPHVFGTGAGWVTAEYGMLPRSTHDRMAREAARGKQGGRTLEIQRLVGRALRAAIDLRALGQRTITLDCDVIQADGGTRTAAITGGWVALALAVRAVRAAKKLAQDPMRRNVAAISVGIVDGKVCLDLDYDEDSTAEVDMNVVATGEGALVEVQGTAEGKPFARADLDRMLDAALGGIVRLSELQRAAAKAS